MNALEIKQLNVSINGQKILNFGNFSWYDCSLYFTFGPCHMVDVCCRLKDEESSR